MTPQLPQSPEFQRKLAALLAEHENDGITKQQQAQAASLPRFVIIGGRVMPDEIVQVSNGFGERGGEVVREVGGGAWLVQVGNQLLVCHEYEASWEVNNSD